jgi:ligand-binding sensor domain-containing protein
MTKRFIFFLLILYGFIAFPQNKISDTYLEGAIISSFQFENKDIWVATYGQGIYHYIASEDKWENFTTQKSNIEQDFFYCIAVSKDYVWAGSGEGLFTYEVKKKQWHKRKFSAGGELGNWIRSFCYDKKENTLWIGRFFNLTKLDVAKQKYSDYDLAYNGDTKSNNIKAIRMDGDSLIWFGTESGVHKYYRNKKIENPNSRVYMSNKGSSFKGEGETVSISDFAFDRSSVWFGTDEFITPQKPKFNVGGIFRYNRKNKWEKFDQEDGLPSNGVYCLESTGNKIWGGLYSFNTKDKKDDPKGIILIDKASNSIMNIDLDELGIKSRKISSMAFDGDYLWFGTDNGLSRLLLSNPFAKWSLQKNKEKINKNYR